MADALSDFELPVAAEYRLVKTVLPNGKPGKVLLASGEKNASPWKPFSPAHAFLFREFAALTPNVESILSFAQRFGYLGEPITFENTIDDGEYAGPMWVESISAGGWPHNWPNEILWMSNTLGIWEAVKKKDEATLNQWARRQRSWRWLFHRFEVVGLPTNDPIWNATEILRTVIDGRLKFTRVGPQVRWASNEPRLRLSYVPRSLIGTLWLQLALAVTEDQTIRTCRNCDRPFEVSKEPTGARTRRDSEFCSVNCKSVDYRRRKSEAKRLWRDGRSVYDIKTTIDRLPAKPTAERRESGTNEDTIKGWIRRWKTEAKAERLAAGR
jgi:hypothetical protein